MWYFATTALNVCWTPRRAWNVLLKQTQAYALRWRNPHKNKSLCVLAFRKLISAWLDENIVDAFVDSCTIRTPTSMWNVILIVVHTYRAEKSEGRRNKTQTYKMTQVESGDISQIKTNNHNKTKSSFMYTNFLNGLQEKLCMCKLKRY